LQYLIPQIWKKKMKRILLAEDDRNLSRSIDILLTLEGYEVITVHHGEEALNKLLQQKFDLLITDIVMPHLSGVELVYRIKQLNPALPIMVVSGKLNDELIEQLQGMKIRHILSKPIKPLEFRTMVEEAFQP